MATQKKRSIIILPGICLLLLLLVCNTAKAQQEQPLSAAAENQLENQVAQSETVTEDDAQWQQLNAYTQHKLSLNTADAAALESLGLLTPLQISNFLAYRQQLSPLLSIYELQAIPGFEPDVIRSILPYAEVGNDLEPHYHLRDYLKKGRHTLLLRYGRQVETSRGFMRTDTTGPHYQGSPDKILLRYRYSFPRYISWGAVMEKDAGEQFFSGAQSSGFDFYSAHLFVRNYRQIKVLALGDFTVNMGQGLINWQAMALGKGPAVMQVKREGELLRPYASAGEFYFYRGAGITVERGCWQGTAFVSMRKIDGNIMELDTLLTEQYVTSLVSSGYHRSLAEVEKRHALQQFSAGGNISFIKRGWHTGINVIQHRYSMPLQKNVQPYNLFVFGGKQLMNVSMDYAGTYKNIHFFGEMALSDNYKPAILQGIMASVAKQVDLTLLYRYYHRAYQSMYANAFGEYYRPANESGLYTALSFRISHRLKLDAYADVFRFPWLQFRNDAPGGGKDFLVAVTYMPDKRTTAFIRYSYSSKQQNVSGGENFMKMQAPVVRRSWRCQVALQPAERFTLKMRMDVNHYNSYTNAQHGFMLFQEMGYQLTSCPLQLSGRCTKFVTGGPESRIYAAATGMLYEYAVSQLYGNGWQYQLRARWRILRGLSLWARFQQAVYQDASANGSGWDQVQGNRNSIWQLQVQQLF